MTLTLPSSQPKQYSTSIQLIGGDDFNAVVAQLNSEKDGIVAGIGGTQAKATQLAAHVNTIKTVTTAADSVKLPKGFTGLQVWVCNADAANDCQVFTYGVGTIGGTDGAATGVNLAHNANAVTIYKCMRIDSVLGEIWLSK
jgi:hypothetical protein